MPVRNDRPAWDRNMSALANLDPEDVDELADNPAGFIEEFLGIKPWEKQTEICESVRDNRRTVVPSCHGAGKTTIAACIALWFLFTRPYSNVVTTAPTGRQVKSLLWKELRKAYHHAEGIWPVGMGGDLLPKNPQLQLDGDAWMCVGFSTDMDVSFQGWHAPGGVLMVFDEAPGVDPMIWKAARNTLTGPDDRFLAIGNPIEAAGPFYDMTTREDAKTIHISALDVPNVVEEKIVIPGLTSIEWVREMQSDCGSNYKEHPDYIARVLGKFPDVDDRVLVPLSWMDAAEERWRVYQDLNAWQQRNCHLGVDVARSGTNKTIIAESYDALGCKRLHKEPKQSTMETAGSVLDIADRSGALTYRIDADGVGAGVYDRLAEQDEKRAREMRGGMRSELDPTRYLNQRAEWYWTLRERLDPEADHALAMPPDKNLRAQLTGMRWKTTSQGKKQIESKDDMLKRGLKSPDEADAVVYSLAIPSAEEFDVISFLEAMTKR